MMVAQGGFDKKEEVENPSEVLLNPSDPEATFRYKAGGKHLGYVGNVVEAVGEKSSLVIDYDYQQNTYADNQFMKDYLNEKKDFSDGSFIVADGAYSGEENSRLASEHNLKLVTTNFTGRKPDEIYADFVFTDDGKYLIKCKNNRVPDWTTSEFVRNNMDDIKGYYELQQKTFIESGDCEETPVDDYVLFDVMEEACAE